MPDHIRPRHPARHVLVIPARCTIRDYKTDDDTYEEGLGSVSGTEVKMARHNQHSQHYVRDSKVKLRAHGDDRDTWYVPCSAISYHHPGKAATIRTSRKKCVQQHSRPYPPNLLPG